MSDNVVVEIVEQPGDVNRRFRYECEGNRSVIFGASDTTEKHSYPAIRVLNYTGTAIVLVSCVTTKEPHWPHPHCLVGNNYCSKGVCKIEFQTDESAPTVITLTNIAIQYCKKADIETTIDERKTLRIDPFKTGFRYAPFDFYSVRLCFQVFLLSRKNSDNSNQAKLTPIAPVVSNIIEETKSGKDLRICDISDSTSQTTGGKKIILFCDKIQKNDIKIRFYRENENNNSIEWEAWGHFKPNNVHRCAGIAFKTPAYATNDIDEPVNVYLQLVRPSDGRRGRPVYFRYVPDYTNINNSIKNKKRKIVDSEALYQYVQEYEEEQRHLSKMKINIKPNVQSNQAPSGGAGVIEPLVSQSNQISNLPCVGQLHAGAPHSYDRNMSKMQINVNHNITSNQVPSGGAGAIEPLVSQSNIISNLPCVGQVHTGAPHSYAIQQSNYCTQRFVQNTLHTQHSNYYTQGQQSLINVPEPQNNQLYHSQNGQIQNGHIQHSQFQPQYQKQHFEHQPFNHLQQQSQNGHPINPPLTNQQPPLNSYHQQVAGLPANFQQTYSYPEYGGNLYGSTPNNPFANHYDKERAYDAKSQNVDQFRSNHNTDINQSTNEFL